MWVRQHWLPVLLLFLTAHLYTHRYVGTYPQLEGDALQNLYFEYHRDRLEKEHLPFQWEYASYLPFAKRDHWVQNFFAWTFQSFFSGIDPVAQALWVNILTSSFSLWLLSLSVYFFCFWLGRSVLGSTLAALIVSSTGFHLLGVRQFNQFYLLSFAALTPTLICWYRVCLRQTAWLGSVLGGTIVGLSLLGSSNAPLFYYLPLAVFLPLLARPKGEWKYLLGTYAFFLLSAVVALFVAASTIVPGFVFLGETNRGALEFTEGMFLGPFAQALTFLFSEWWMPRGYAAIHSDFYIGPLVLFLAGMGLWGRFQRFMSEKRQSSDRETVFFCFLLFCLMWAGLMLQYPRLPQWLAVAIERFYLQLSIRQPNRFFMLALLPIAYFSAYAVDHWTANRHRISLGVGIVGMSGLVIWTIVPNWNNLYGSLQLTALLSLGFSFLGLLMLFVFDRSNQRFVGLAIGGAVFLSLFYSKLPQAYHTWHLRYFAEQLLPMKFSQFLGFGFQYSELTKSGNRVLNASGKYPLGAPQKNGKILIEDEENFRSSAYHAPSTGHRFAFTRHLDSAGNRYLSELYSIRTEALLDMANVCWVVTPSTEGFQTQQRKSCLPQAYLVGSAQAVRSEQQARRWAKEATREKFQNEVSVYCEEAECGNLPRNPKPQYSLSTLRQMQGVYEFEGESSASALLFLSQTFRFDWKAWVNGRPAKLFRANHAFMAVVVPKGRFQVTLKLEPWVGPLARKITWVSLGILALLGLSLWATKGQLVGVVRRSAETLLRRLSAQPNHRVRQETF